MLNLTNVEMSVRMNKENKVKYLFFAYDENNRRVVLDPKRLTDEEKNYVQAKFAQVLKKTVNDWTDIWR